jgi:hypothetical protein
VDLRRLAIDEVPTDPPAEGQEMIPPWVTMQMNHWAHACDILAKMVIAPQESIRQEVAQIDISIRSTAAAAWRDWPKDAYAAIRGLHKALGFDNARYGSWKDVPILQTAHQGVKRRLPAFDGARTRSKLVVERNEDLE